MKNMLLTLGKHKIFQQAVEFITMGKWLKCGMVVASKQQQTVLQDLLTRQLPTVPQPELMVMKPIPFFQNW